MHPVIVERGRERIAKLAERDGELTFAREVRAGAWDHRRDVQHAIFDESLKVHQIRCAGISGFAQKAQLLRSDNPHMTYPAFGVLVILEQGTDLSIIKAVFHKRHDDNTLGPPVSADHPHFIPGDWS